MKILLQRFNEHGVPIYTAPEPVPMPEPFVLVTRLEYPADRDVMVAAGYTTAHPPPPHGDVRTWGMHKIVGPVIARFDGWTKGPRQPRWQIRVDAYATEWNSEYTHSLAVAGQCLFTCGNGMGRASPWIRAYDLETGAELTSQDRRILPFGRDDYSIIFDTTRAITAHHRRADNSYLIFAEENGRAKQWVFRWRPGLVAPAAPRGLAVAGAADGRTVRVSWEPVPGAVSYRLERGLHSPTGWGRWTIVADALTTNTWLDAGIPPGASARYRVRARGPNGTLGNQSVERYARTLAWEGENLPAMKVLSLPAGWTSEIIHGEWLSGGNRALALKPAQAGESCQIILPNIPPGRWTLWVQCASFGADDGRIRITAGRKSAEEDLAAVALYPYANLQARPLLELAVEQPSESPLAVEVTALDHKPVSIDVIRLEPARPY